MSDQEGLGQMALVVEGVVGTCMADSMVVAALDLQIGSCQSVVECCLQQNPNVHHHLLQRNFHCRSCFPTIGLAAVGIPKDAEVGRWQETYHENVMAAECLAKHPVVDTLVDVPLLADAWN